MTFPELIAAKAHNAEQVKRHRYFVRMFKPQFSPLVEAGTKLQTVRPVPKFMPGPGDTISLRTWTGKPYRSKMRTLREARILQVVAIEIGQFGEIEVDGVLLPPADSSIFAIKDGFSGWVEMCDWFRAEHGLPFKGILIQWEGVTPQEKTAK